MTPEIAARALDRITRPAPPRERPENRPLTPWRIEAYLRGTAPPPPSLEPALRARGLTGRQGIATLWVELVSQGT